MVFRWLSFLLVSQSVLSSTFEDLQPIKINSKPSQSSALSGKIKAGIGNILYDETKLKLEVQKTINTKKNELLPFFSSETEFNKFTQQIINQGIDEHLRDKKKQLNLSNDGLIQFTAKLGRDIFGLIIEKKVKNAEVWKSKIFSHFNQCINKSSTYEEASSLCLEILKNETIIGIGQAIVAETTQENFSEIDLKQNDQKFKNCLAPKLKKETQVSDVTKCSLDVIKESTAIVTRIRLTESLRDALSGSQLNEEEKSKIISSIQIEISNELDKCLSQIGKKEDENYALAFETCGNQTKSKSADKVLEATLSYHPLIQKTLQDNFKDDSERLSLQRKIILEQQKNYAKLSVDNKPMTYIKDQITKSTTVTLAENVTKQKLAENKIPFKPELVNQLRSCLENSEDNRVCLNELTTNISSIILDDKIKIVPSQSQRQKLKNELIRDLKKCLDQTDNSTCTETLTNDATIKISSTIGDQKVKDVLGKDGPVEEFVKFKTTLSQCVKGSSNKDPCVKKYFTDLSYHLGKLALQSKIGSVLGKDEFGNHFIGHNKPLSQYQVCLKKIEENSSIELAVLDQEIEKCSDHLRRNSSAILRSLLSSKVKPNEALTEEDKQFIDSILCLDLSGIKDEKYISLTNQTKPILDTLAAQSELVLNYDSEKASQNITILQKFLQKLATQKNMPEDEKQQLIEKFLNKENILDLFLKATVRQNIKEAMSQIPSSPEEASQNGGFWIRDPVKKYLSSKENIDNIFGDKWIGSKNRSELNRGISRLLTSDIFKDGKVNQAELINKIKEKFIVPQISESYGIKEVLVPHIIQEKITSKVNGITGKSYPLTISWTKVRKTEKGKKVENYIVESLLKPKLGGKEEDPKTSRDKIEKVQNDVISAILAYPLASK